MKVIIDHKHIEEMVDLVTEAANLIAALTIHEAKETAKKTILDKLDNLTERIAES